MNNGKLFNKIFEQVREPVLTNKMNSTLSEDSPLLAQLHSIALNNPTYTVDHVLKLANVSYNQYSTLIKTGFSIPQIRKLQTGKTRELTAVQKDSFLTRVHKKPNKPVSSKTKRSYVGHGSDPSPPSGDDERLRALYGMK